MKTYKTLRFNQLLCSLVCEQRWKWKKKALVMNGSISAFLSDVQLSAADRIAAFLVQVSAELTQWEDSVILFVDLLSINNNAYVVVSSMVFNSGNSQLFKGLKDKPVQIQLFIYLFLLTVWLYECVCPCVLQVIFFLFPSTYGVLVPFLKAAILWTSDSQAFTLSLWNFAQCARE